MNFQKRLWSFLYLTLLFCACSLTSLLIIHHSSLEKNYHHLMTFNQTEKMYQLSDTLTGDIEQEYLQTKGFTPLQEFYLDLNKTFNHEYIYTFNQSMDIYDFKGDLEFSKSYFSTYDGTWDADMLEVYPTLALQVNENAVDYYHLTATNGFSFSSSDYLLSDTKAIPIMLGNDFNEFYQVGDRIKGIYLYDDLTFEVKGFLDKDINIPIRLNADSTNLNKYVIIPVFQDHNHYLSTKTNNLHSLQIINGLLINSKGDYLNQKLVNELADKHDLPHSYLMNSDYSIQLLIFWLNAKLVCIICLVILWSLIIYIDIKYRPISTQKVAILLWTMIYLLSNLLIINTIKIFSFKFAGYHFIFIILLYLIKEIIFRKYHNNK